MTHKIVSDGGETFRTIQSNGGVYAEHITSASLGVNMTITAGTIDVNPALNDAMLERLRHEFQYAVALPGEVEYVINKRN